MPSNDDLLFAEHAVRNGYLTEEDVQESLGVQRRMEEMGVKESLRNVLVKRGVLREGDAALVSRAAGLRLGREPIPGYTLEARIGTGAMGSVYRAFQRGMNRHVAIKILRRDLTDDPRQVERLQREAALVGRLDHPHIVRGLDAGETDGLIWFVMELVEGQTLRQRIKKEGQLGAEEVVATAQKIASALVHAHEHGIVHRDIKPGNILLTKDGEPRLTDYGLAKGETDDALTQLDATLGTPQYIAPEQARNPRDVDIRSDIYCLGATVYAMLTGHPPYQAPTLAATLTKVLYERPTPLAEAAPETPPELRYVVERMMAKDRRHRYPTPEDLLRDLDALEAGSLRVPAGFRGDIEEFVETRHRRRIALLAAVLVTTAVGVAISVQWWQRRVEREDREVAAAADLEQLLVRPGPRTSWTGQTVDEMIRELERHVTEFAGTPAAKQALAHLQRWRRQEAAIGRVQQLTTRVDGESRPRWPELLADLRAAEARLSEDGDATVAVGWLTGLVEDVEKRRDRSARALIDEAEGEVAELSLQDAAGRFEALARELRERFYGLGTATLAEEAEALVGDFRRAQRLLDEHFLTYDRAIREADLLTADLKAFENDLFGVLLAADTGELPELLGRLPPRGVRREIVSLRHGTELLRLRDASRRRWGDVRAEAQRLRRERRYGDAVRLLDDFARKALAAQRTEAVGLKDEIVAQRQLEERELRETTNGAARDFLSALGRRDYREARDGLDEHALFTVGWSEPDGPAGVFVDAARRLLTLLEERVWSPFRRRLSSRVPIEHGLSFGPGIRYQSVRDVVVGPDSLEFTHGTDLRWEGSLFDVSLEDLLRYAGFPAADAEGGLVHAALVLVESSPDADARETLEALKDLGPLLEGARAKPDLVAIVERLTKRRRELVAAAEGDLLEAEELARHFHEEAVRAMDEGRYSDAWQQFDSLLRLQRMRKTAYVLARRDELQQQRERAARGRETSRYAERLPGAQLIDVGSGRAQMRIDFERSDADEALSLAPGHTTIAERRRIVADRPGGEGDSFPLRTDHYLAWSAWDGVPENHPRLFPVEIPNPFEHRRRVEVAFTYRSESPFFLAVSIGGTTVGVLSASNVREAGRGVRIWHADSLASPDEKFGERHRSVFLARHPEVLKRDGDTTYFQFEPGRSYRVRFVKDERRAALYVDGVKRVEDDVRTSGGAPLAGRILFLSYTSGEVDDLRVSGILDPDWLRRRK